MIRRRAWPLLLLTVLGCVGPFAIGGEDYDLADADLRVAFVGNSLTYTHDVPGMVQALADMDGRSMSHVSITAPNASLEDHWYMGTQDVIRELEPDVVVMQQGPSSLAANQIHLAQWADRFDSVIREVGGEPALYMVWPSDSRRGAFDAVWSAYQGAAERVQGLFMPAGQTWVEAWALDPDLAFYGPDGFHPSQLGALAAAQTIYAVLYDLPADSVPTLDLGIDAATLATVNAGLAASLERARPSEPGDTATAGAGVDVLFVGNSLTQTHDVPGLVRSMAEADGRSVTYESIVMPASSLEDHWNAGTPDSVLALAPGLVVMQQGPSSLPENRTHLIHWSRQLAGVVRQAGGDPALFMVWPSADRADYFDDVWTSYKLAADSAGGLFIPAGQTWVEAWALDPGLELYGFDDFHPSYLGALAAAQTIYATVYGVPADSVPALDDGVDSATLATLREALAASLESAGDSVAPSSSLLTLSGR